MQSHQLVSGVQETKEAMSLSALPPDIIWLTVQKLPISSVIRLLRASKKLRQIIMNDESKAFNLFWKERLKAYFPLVCQAVASSASTSEYANRFIEHYILTIKNISTVNLVRANEVVKGDEEIVMAAVRESGFALEFAEESLRANREIVLAALRRTGFAIRYADASLHADREIVLAAVQQDGRALLYADKKLRVDREIVLAAVQQDGRVLGYADKKLRADREIVLAAVQQNGYALLHADKKLKADRKIVLAAVQQDGYALLHANEELQADRKIVLAAIRQNYKVFFSADKSVYRDAASLYLPIGSNDALHWRGTTSTTYKLRLLERIAVNLQDPNFTRENILDLFDAIKKPEGLFGALHQQRNKIWDSIGLTLFQVGKNSRDETAFWHTESYQKAVKMLKEAYLQRGDADQSDKGRENEASALIDYSRRNLFGEAKKTKTREAIEMQRQQPTL